MASEAPGSPGVDAQQGDSAAYDPTSWPQAVGNSVDEVDDGEEQDEEGYPITQADQDVDGSQASADIDEDSAEYDPEYDPEPANGDNDYNPESSVAPVQSAPAVEEPSVSAVPSRPTKKPKTAGGFLVGSSDDEDDTPAPVPKNLKPTPNDAQVPPPTHSPVPQANGAGNVHNTQYAQSHNTRVQTAEQPPAVAAPPAKSRLPTDIVGSLEDRIHEDPKGDTDAWFTLIAELKRRHQLDDARKTYERFLEIFPQAAEVWVEYLNMELSLDNFGAAEGIFSRTLFSVPHVQLWTAYLNYVRRRNDLNDPTGQARQTVSQAYAFVLDNVGQDRDAGTIWQDYIMFIKSGPGQIGGTSWQDQQKMDLLRKAYQRAICVPIANLNVLWKEYDSFEMGLNKMTGRKHLQERSPAYMTARSANTALENITRGLNRTTLPRLPPAPGFDGDQEFMEQVRLWKAWIEWEKDDPLVLKSDDLATYQQRVLHVYSHALMALRFWPEMWVDAAEWCFTDSVMKGEKEAGLPMLVDGVAANPESALLALKHADYIELTQRTGEDDESKSSLAQAVRAPYDKVLDTLYAMIEKIKKRKEAAVAKIKQETTADAAAYANPTADDDDDEGEIKEGSAFAAAKEDKIKAVEAGFAVQTQMLTQQISYLWIALSRAFRRFQGQGKTSPPTGLRGIFTEARGRGRLNSDVYIAIAQIEWDVYQDPVATKIFERGAKLFPHNADFFVEYLKHLHARRDFTNARVVFSQTVKRFRDRLADQPELLPQLKPLYLYFHSYEAKYGELAQVRELEKQMAELFPGDSDLTPFAARFATERFNPISARVIISTAQQMRPKMGAIQSIENGSPSVRATPQPVALPIAQADRSPRFPTMATRDTVLDSPKRPFQADDGDDYNPPRKVARGVSPLKGAAGRRLDQQRRQGGVAHSGPAVAIPRDITFLIGLIPPADNFNRHQFNPERMIRLIQNTPIPDFADWKSRQEQSNARTMTRPASSEYPPYQRTGRDSPGLTGRPVSPYGGTARPSVQSQTTYRNSPLRPGSSGSYEPPPAPSYQPPGPSPFNPITQHLPAGMNNVYGGWQNPYADNSAQYPPSHQTHQAQPPSYNGYHY